MRALLVLTALFATGCAAPHALPEFDFSETQTVQCVMGETVERVGKELVVISPSPGNRLSCVI